MTESTQTPDRHCITCGSPIYECMGCCHPDDVLEAMNSWGEPVWIREWCLKCVLLGKHREEEGKDEKDSR